MKVRVVLSLLLLAALLTGLVVPGAVAQGPRAAVEGPAVDKGKDLGKPQEVQGPPLGVQAGAEGVATDYAWSQDVGTYTEITGGTVVTTSCDDTSYNNYAIPFTFTYNGTGYTAFSIQCNGFIAMGSSVSSSYYPLSSGTTNNVISALGADQQTNTGGEIRYEVLGTEPDRVLVVQYKNFKHYGSGYTGDWYNFQIRLYETSNVVQVVYGSFTEVGSFTQQVGLRGNSNADFNNRKGSTGWTNTVAGTTNADTVLLSTAYVPPSGLTWTWTPVPPHPIFDASTKTATAEVSVGQDIDYTVVIKNTGNADATAATMVDPIPAGTAYNGDVACDAGTCGFDGTNVWWSGTVAIGAQVTVTFSVNTAALACGDYVTNVATMNDPGLIGGPVTRSAGTQIVGMINDLVTEGFEVSVPPPGWTETIVNDPGTDPDWTKESVGTYPTIYPHGGGFMAKFNSFNASNGASARLATYALDFSTVGLPRVQFWMSHDTGYTGNADRLQIQASIDGGLTWADVGAPVLRYDPAYTTPGWGLHTVSLAAYTGLPSVMVGFLGISAYGNNFYLDDVAIQDACGHPMVMLWPDSAGTACPGTSIDYTLNVKNVNLDPDTIDLTVPSYVWPTSVAPTSLYLGPNETGQVVVTVQVPWGAVPPASDVATVLATALGTGETDTATVTTTASAGGWATTMQNKAVGGEPSLYWGASYYYNGNVCVVGGLTGPSGSIVVSGAQWCYNIASQTWTQKTSMLYALFGTAYGLIGDKFYMAGGFDINFNGYTHLQIYDIATDSWSTGAALPSARGGQAGGVVNGKLYSAGGSSTSSFPTDCPTYEYDPVANAWTTKAACPLQGGYGFDLGGSVGSDTWGKFFAGGHFGAYYGWYAFDPLANTWTTLANLPFHKTPLMVENPLNGDIYSISGLIGWVGQNQIWKYDYTANTWANTGVTLITTQGGSLGPAHGSFGDPLLQGFWTLGGTVGSGSLTPSPFEFWQFITCPTCEPPGNLSFWWDPYAPVAGEEVTFYGSASGSEPLEFTWDFGDGGGGGGAVATHTYADPGAYPVTMTVSNACGSGSLEHEVVVSPPPEGRMWINKMKMNQRPAMQPGYYKVIALFRIYGEPPSYPPPSRPVIEGADAFGTWTYPDLTTHPQQAIMLTDPLGRTKFRVKEPQCGTYQFCLDNLVKAGYAYDPASNQMGPCMSINVPCK